MITLELNQGKLKDGEHYPLTQLSKIAKVVEDFFRVKHPSVVSIAFVSEKEIRKLNNHYRGKDSVTDVLSFEMDKDGSEIGELILCYKQAKRQAKEMQHSVIDEISFLIVHGLLHLFGEDHEKESKAKKMFKKQTAILNTLGIDPRI